MINVKTSRGSYFTGQNRPKNLLWQSLELSPESVYTVRKWVTNIAVTTRAQLANRLGCFLEWQLKPIKDLLILTIRCTAIFMSFYVIISVSTSNIDWLNKEFCWQDINENTVTFPPPGFLMLRGKPINVSYVFKQKLKMWYLSLWVSS